MGVSAAAPPRCTAHGNVLAGWSCRACGAHLCPDCVFVARTGPVELESCVRCRGLADRLTVPRSTVQRLEDRAWRALSYPFERDAMVLLAATGVVLAFFAYFGLPGLLIRSGLYWAFVFLVIRQGARGLGVIHPPDFSDLFSDVVAPALRGFLAVAIVWVPALLRISSRVGSPLAPLEDAILDPVIWVLAAAGALYVPAALLVAAWGSWLDVLNPMHVLRIAERLGRDYLVAVAFVAGAFWVDLLLRLALRPVGGIPVLGNVLLEIAGLYAPAVAAHVLGVLLHLRGDTVGLGVAADYEVAVLPGAIPRAPEPVATAAPAAPPAGPALGPVPPADPAVITAAVQASDLARAAALYAALGDAAPELPPRILFQVARGAAQAGDHVSAARALHFAAVAGDPEVAPDALLVLGRIYGGRLGRPAEARQVLEHLVQQYPDSAAARHAQAALASGRGQG